MRLAAVSDSLLLIYLSPAPLRGVAAAAEAVTKNLFCSAEAAARNSRRRAPRFRTPATRSTSRVVGGLRDGVTRFNALARAARFHGQIHATNQTGISGARSLRRRAACLRSPPARRDQGASFAASLRGSVPLRRSGSRRRSPPSRPTSRPLLRAIARSCSLGGTSSDTRVEPPSPLIGYVLERAPGRRL
jgi:hypothetical protein